MGSQTELVRMKILNVLILFIGFAQCGRPNENCWKECDWTDYIALVKCPVLPVDPDPAAPTTPTPLGCSCEKKDDPVDCLESLGEIKPNQGWEDCQLLTNTVTISGDKATHFRWENKTTHTYCYFLPNCDTSIPSGCVPFVGAPCVAGGVGGCDVATPTCTPAKWNDAGLHWTCLNGYHTVNPYKGEDDGSGILKIPAGTTCTTGSVVNEACSTWKWAAGEHDNVLKVAQVNCTETGWEIQAGAFELMTQDDVSILPDQENQDATCKCDKLKFVPEIFDDPGINLVCDTIINTTEDEAGIVFPNGCALLCDGHFMMYIECYKGKWMNTAEYPFKEVGPADIKC